MISVTVAVWQIRERRKSWRRCFGLLSVSGGIKCAQMKLNGSRRSWAAGHMGNVGLVVMFLATAVTGVIGAAAENRLVNFPDYLAKDHVDQYGEKTCWRLEVTPPPEQLILHSWRMQDGKEIYPWTSSVLASDLDPQSIAIEEPHEEGDLYSLRVNCLFYRDAVTEKRAFDPSFLRKTLVLRFSLAQGTSDAEQARNSLRDFLTKCGRRTAVIRPESIEDLLKPLQGALEPVSRTVTHSQDGQYQFKHTVAVTVKEQQVLLVLKTDRIGKPINSILPAFEVDTFDLLSLDTKKVDVRRVSEEYAASAWDVGLFAVEQFDTRLHQSSSNSKTYRMWYIDVLFPTEPEARQFGTICVSAVEQIRERLCQLHRERPN